jgi:hypothetical protein
MTYLDHLAIALEDFANKVDGMDMGPLDHLTCTEANSLAHLMQAYRQNEDEAITVILRHIGEDEEQDELREHLDEYPELAAILRKERGNNPDMMHMLDEIEKEGQ